MGCLYSIYSTEDKRLISILKHYNCSTKSQFLKIKEALRYRNEHIITPNGKRNLSFQTLICFCIDFILKLILTVFMNLLGIRKKKTLYLKTTL